MSQIGSALKPSRSQPAAYAPPVPPPEPQATPAPAPQGVTSADGLFDNPPSDPHGDTQLVNVFGEFGNRPGPVPRFGSAGFEQATFLDEGYDTDVEISPDGKWIVFASTRHHEKPEIYLQRVGGVSVTQLTTDEADDAFPTFSPDGKRIAFSSTRNGNWDLYLMDVDGRNITQLTATNNMQELHPTFSPDGSRLAYCAAGTRSGQWELWTIDLASTERRMIGYGLFPAWSPRKDKDQLAFQRARQRGSRWFSVWTLDLVEGEARNVSEVAVSSNAAVVSPSWSPDGSMLAFSTIVNPGLGAGPRGGTPSGVAAGQQDVWVVNADGTGRRRVTDGNGVNATPSWSRDGRVFFVSDRGGIDAVWSARVAAGPKVMTAERLEPRPETKENPDPFANTDRRELGP